MKGTTAYILAKKLFDGLSSGYQSNTVTDNADGSKTLTINFVNGDTAQITFSPVKGDKGDTGTGVADLKITTTSGVRHLTAVFDDGTEKDCGILPNEQYDDTQIKSDISSLQTGKVDKVTGKSLIDDAEIARLKDVDNYDDTAIKTLINTVANGLMASAGYSADYKNVEIVTVGGTKKSIDVAPIISHAKVTELSDVDGTNQGNGKTLIYNSATGKHEYVDSSSTDELVKMDSTSTAKYLGDLIDKTTIVTDNGKLVAKTLDGLTTSITELNYIKGLQMPVQDLVTAFANGGLKTIDTPFPTYADLQAYDVSTLLDDIRYLVRVLTDETHEGKITAYLIKKGQTAPTFYGYLSDSRDFSTNPIDLMTEITGKLKAKNIDADDLFALLTLSDVYKTATTKDEIFGTHGAKAMYDELVADIGNKADNTTLTTHTADTDIHTSTTEKAKWNTVTSKASQTDLDTHTGDTTVHITSAERTAWNGKIDKTSITTTIDSTSTDNQYPSALAVKTELDKKIDKTDIIDNLTSTYVDKTLSANQGKILEDKKLNKADVNKFNLINLDGVSLKEYILENCTDEKTYYLIARSTCTDTPKSNTHFYVIVEKVGSFTHKVTAKELNTNEEYTCTYRSDTSTWYGWDKVCTTSVADVSTTVINSFEDETFIKPTGKSVCSYYVKDGQCYITLETTVVATNNNFTSVLSDLPKPKWSVYSNAISRNMVSGGSKGLFQLRTDGKLYVVCYYDSTGASLYVTLSYPVAES